MELYDNRPEKILTDFLTEYYSDQLHSILLSSDLRLHYPLYVDFAEVLEHDSPLSHEILFEPTKYLRIFDESAKLAQEIMFGQAKKVWEHERQKEDLERPPPSIKEFVHVRIEIHGPMLDNPELCPSIGRVRVKHRGILLTLKGTVIRSGSIKMIDGEREYECRKCKHRFKVHPELESRNSIPKPISCPSKKPYCESTSFQLLEGGKICHDYQEIKIQESTQVLGVGAIPRSVPVILQDDLVDIVKAGDDVIVTGVLTAKWSPELKDVRCDLEPVFVANYVRRINEVKLDIEIPDDIVWKFKTFWSDFKDTPLNGRNAILRAICPQVYGLFTVKLAVALTLIGGVQHVDGSGTKVRGESHLLLVGDPGTGKSQFLKFAAKLSKRSVITTGLGSSSAGLTVTAVKDGGEWMLEAGALVLADGGLCCIDEFDSMREHDRATIHEAMEQQTISVAKAGLVTTLSTRTIVFGATNPKGRYDPEQSLSINTTLSGPLISRFDIVLVLLDTKNPDWDKVVSDHILDQAEPEKDKCHEDLGKMWPLSMLRRYIHFVKGYFRPTLTKEAESVISRYYQLQRRTGKENAARTTVRMLESLIRLAQAHARLMFRNEVTRLDAITAILCIESSMTTSAIVDSAGNALHSNFTDNPDQQYVMQEKQILAKLNSPDEFPDAITL
ncbi:probable DNA helicase MCM9 isoform X2 [Cynara cardunculus var. scolymus]|uniref:probable DNA helicase MCM9 isoform X2 n=1 Tax=Cynara cardunculus var. scolymus TaxID=59895 RepID=UPI000D629086|nr:probable DNA helicase MCM9 isoform X2 [Cynara cardunculus var. scolymus]